MKGSPPQDHVRLIIENATKKANYVLGGSVIVLVNPSRKDISFVDAELKDSVIVIHGSPLCLGLAMDSTIRHFFTPIIEELRSISELEQASILDLSATAGLFSILASAMGAPQVHLVSDDPETVKMNLKFNSCPAHLISKAKLSSLKNLDLVIHDLSFFPSVRLLSQSADRLKNGGILAVVGMLGQQIQMLTRALEASGMQVVLLDWANEQCLMLLKKSGNRI